MLEPIMETYGLLDNFIQMLIFDFLIGNTDRPHHNWGFIRERDQFSFSPLYDNSSSLCAYISGKKLTQYLGKDQTAWNSLVDTKSKSRIRIGFYDPKEPTHKQIMEYLKDKYYDKSYPYVQMIESKITDDKISDILEQYTENLLPPNKKLIIQRFLHDKVQILREIFRKEE